MRRALATIMAGAALLLLIGGSALANGAPVDIFLSYLPELSNTGPESATGEARLSIGEATLDLTTMGLPRLEGQQYEVWLQEARSEDLFSLGTFNAAASGETSYSAEFPEIPDVEYRYMRLSVEPSPDTDAAPSGQWSLAGVFPNEAVQPSPTAGIAGVATATLPPGVTPTPEAPAALPVTGGPGNGLWLLAGAGLLAGLLLLGLNLKRKTT